MWWRYDRQRTDGNDPAERVSAQYEPTIEGRYWPGWRGATAATKTTIRSERWCSESKKNIFDLHWQRQQHNEDAGMRENVLHRQWRQQRTEGLAMAGLEKGDLFVFKKTVCVALRKAFWFALKKAVFSLKKNRFFRFEKSGLGCFEKSVLVVFETEGCVYRGANATTRIGGSPM